MPVAILIASGRLARPFAGLIRLWTDEPPEHLAHAVLEFCGDPIGVGDPSSAVSRSAAGRLPLRGLGGVGRRPPALYRAWGPARRSTAGVRLSGVVVPPSTGLRSVSLAGGARAGRRHRPRKASPLVPAARATAIPGGAAIARPRAGPEGHGPIAGRRSGASPARVGRSRRRAGRGGTMTHQEPPDEWTDGPTCGYCRGAIPPR